MPFGTSFGVVYEFDSGHAWQRRAMVPLYDDYYGFPEGRGTRFMPPVHYIDMRVAHRVDLRAGRAVELTLDMFNVPDFEQAVTNYENDTASFGKVLFRQQPRAVRGGVRLTY